MERKNANRSCLRCYECGGRGHFGRECPTRLRKEKKLSDSPGRKSPSELSKSSHAPGEKQGTAISGNECRVLRVFTPGKERHSPQRMRQTEEPYPGSHTPSRRDLTIALDDRVGDLLKRHQSKDTSSISGFLVLLFLSQRECS